jgi:hypothetical protein
MVFATNVRRAEVYTSKSGGRLKLARPMRRGRTIGIESKGTMTEIMCPFCVELWKKQKRDVNGKN